jgi:hypothetical protein
MVPSPLLRVTVGGGLLYPRSPPAPLAADKSSGMEPLPPGSPPAGDDHDPVPVFRTWPRIYAAVILCALSVMGLIALFSSWKY